MPCTYTGSLEGDALLGAREELDELTRLLCEAMTVIEYQIPKGHISDELWAWWKHHKAADKKRRKKGK